MINWITLAQVDHIFLTLNRQLEGKVNCHRYPDIHLRVSSSHRIGPTQGQRKTLTKVAIEFMSGRDETIPLLYTARTKKLRKTSLF